MSLLNKRNKSLSTLSLALLITGAIDSIRNLPASALFGSALIFFFIFGAIVFLIPVAVVSAELSSTWTEEGGIYSWVKRAFGEKIGFFAIWLQWINTMVWYPTILSFIGGTVAFLIEPQLAQNKLYLVTIILFTFWILTWINLKGIQTSAQFASFCAIVGMLFPMALIILLAIIWIVMGKPLQIHLTTHDLFPTFKLSKSWVSLTAIMTAYLGIELAAVHVNNIKQPKKTFPKALFYSTLLILTTMILGSLSIAFVLPYHQINLVDGVVEAFSNFFKAYHMNWFMPIITTMLLIGSLGGMINWMISPAKGLLQAAQHHYLPDFLKKENKHGVAGNLLITQAVLVSLMCFTFLLMPSVNGSYWLLTDLSTQLYMLMYIIMFIAALYLRHKFANQTRSFCIPGGKVGIWVVCLLGIIGCVITFIVGFFPPNGIDVGSKLHYEVIFTCGIIAMISPSLLFYGYKFFKRRYFFINSSLLS